MTTSTEIRDNAENLVDLKAVEAAIVVKFDEIQGVYDTANAEIKELGEAKAETVGKLEAFAKQYDELYDRVQVIEQKGAVIAETHAGQNIGSEFVKSEAFQMMQEGKLGRARLEYKTAIINATGQNQPLVQSDRDMSGVYTTPNRNLRIRDLLPSSTTGSNLIEFTRENTFTNNAGPQIGASPEAYENQTKPESAITFTLVNEPVVTLAHFIPASKQVMEDSPMLESHINGRLMYGLKLKEETQLLLGTGSNHELNGLVTQATAYTLRSPNLTNEMDIIRDMIRQAQVAEYQPDFCVLHPTDWYDIEIVKTGNTATDIRYVVGDPRSSLAPSLWGLPVVLSNSVGAAKVLIGSSAACEIKDRQQAVVEASLEDSTNFQKNMVTVRAEERIALVVYRTEAFIDATI